MVAFISAKDIPGSNMTGPVVYDETVFADDKVDLSVNQCSFCAIFLTRDIMTVFALYIEVCS